MAFQFLRLERSFMCVGFCFLAFILGSKNLDSPVLGPSEFFFTDLENSGSHRVKNLWNRTEI